MLRTNLLVFSLLLSLFPHVALCTSRTLQRASGETSGADEVPLDVLQETNATSKFFDLTDSQGSGISQVWFHQHDPSTAAVEMKGVVSMFGWGGFAALLKTGVNLDLSGRAGFLITYINADVIERRIGFRVKDNGEATTRDHAGLAQSAYYSFFEANKDPNGRVEQQVFLPLDSFRCGSTRASAVFNPCGYYLCPLFANQCGSAGPDWARITEFGFVLTNEGLPSDAPGEAPVQEGPMKLLVVSVEAVLAAPGPDVPPGLATPLWNQLAEPQIEFPVPIPQTLAGELPQLIWMEGEDNSMNPREKGQMCLGVDMDHSTFPPDGEFLAGGESALLAIVPCDKQYMRHLEWVYTSEGLLKFPGKDEWLCLTGVDPWIAPKIEGGLEELFGGGASVSLSPCVEPRVASQKWSVTRAGRIHMTNSHCTCLTSTVMFRDMGALGANQYPTVMTAPCDKGSFMSKLQEWKGFELVSTDETDAQHAEYEAWYYSPEYDQECFEQMVTFDGRMMDVAQREAMYKDVYEGLKAGEFGMKQGVVEMDEGRWDAWEMEPDWAALMDPEIVRSVYLSFLRLVQGDPSAAADLAAGWEQHSETILFALTGSTQTPESRDIKEILIMLEGFLFDLDWLGGDGDDGDGFGAMIQELLGMFGGSFDFLYEFLGLETDGYATETGTEKTGTNAAFPGLDVLLQGLLGGGMFGGMFGDTDTAEGGEVNLLDQIIPWMLSIMGGETPGDAHPNKQAGMAGPDMGLLQLMQMFMGGGLAPTSITGPWDPTWRGEDDDDDDDQRAGLKTGMAGEGAGMRPFWQRLWMPEGMMPGAEVQGAREGEGENKSGVVSEKEDGDQEEEGGVEEEPISAMAAPGEKTKNEKALEDEDDGDGDGNKWVIAFAVVGVVAVLLLAGMAGYAVHKWRKNRPAADPAAAVSFTNLADPPPVLGIPAKGQPDV